MGQSRENRPHGHRIVVDISDRLAHLIPADELGPFCRRWKVRELSLFGSVLRDDFSPASDADVLVSFDDDALWSLWDLTTMQDELAALIGRRVDLVEREGLRNPFRRNRILDTRRVIYVAGQG